MRDIKVNKLTIRREEVNCFALSLETKNRPGQFGKYWQILTPTAAKNCRDLNFDLTYTQRVNIIDKAALQRTTDLAIVLSNEGEAFVSIMMCISFWPRVTLRCLQT